MAKTHRTRGSKGAESFFKAHKYIRDTMAWRQLSPVAMAAWLAFGWEFYGSNNGMIAISCRQLAGKLNIGKTAAAAAIQELITYGFIEITQSGSYSGKRRTAEYRLTHLNCDRTGELASRAFQNIGKHPIAGNGQACPSPRGRTDSPHTGTDQSAGADWAMSISPRGRTVAS
jgi:hypothetical protein